MELSAIKTLRGSFAGGRHGTCECPRCLGERGHVYTLISVGRRVAAAPERAIGGKMSQ
jgi:hypothetical protein